MFTSDPASAGPRVANGTPQHTQRVGGLEVFAQGVAGVAPSVALATVPGALFLIAGDGALWSLVVAGVLALLVAVPLSLQGKRTTSAAPLGAYARNGLGPWGAAAAAWSLLLGYLGFAAGGLLGGGLYLSGFLAKLGIGSTGSTWTGLIVVGVVVVPAVWFPLRGLHVAARAQLALEALSLVAICIILVAAWIRHGFALDLRQLSGVGSSSTVIIFGAVFGIGAFAGFESPAALSLEAREPQRLIPRVLIRTVLGLAVLFVVATYSEVLAFTGGHAGLSADSAPLAVAAANAGVGWTSYIVDLGITLGMIAFVSAMFSAGARSLKTFAEDGALPRWVASTEQRTGVPVVGVTVLGAIATTLAVVFTVMGPGRLLASVYIASASTYGFLVSYLLVAIATPLWLRRIGELTVVAVAASTLAAAGIAYVLYRTVAAGQQHPYNEFPYIFAGCLALGLLRFGWLAARRPEVAAGFGAPRG